MTPDKYEGQAKIADTGWGCVSTPGAVSLWMTLHARYGKLPFADLFEPAIKYAHDGFRVSYMVARQWDAAIARLKGQDGLGQGVPAQRPRARCRARLWKFPDQAKTLRMIAESKGEAFYRGELAEAIDKYARETGGALRRNDLESHTPDWVDPIGLTYRGTTLHEIPPNGQGIAACMALGILENFDVAGHDARRPRDGASADRGDEARLRRPLSLRRRSALHGGDADADARQGLPQEPRQADRSEEGAGFRPGRAEGRQHDLSRHRRRVRHDGVADPVELHRLRLGHRGARHRHRPAQPGERLRHHQGPSQPGRAEEAAVPHHHPRLHHQGRQAGRDLRPDGRRHAAAGPHAGLLAHRRLRAEPAGRHRCAALAGARERRHGVDGEPLPGRHRDRARIARGHKLTRTQWPSFAFGSSQIIWKFPEGGPYLGASESRRDGAAVGF